MLIISNAQKRPCSAAFESPPQQEAAEQQRDDTGNGQGKDGPTKGSQLATQALRFTPLGG